MATTTFVDDGIVVRSAYETGLKSDDFVVRLQNISDFMSKPYLVGNYTWSTSQLKNTQLTFCDLGQLLVSNPYWLNKIQGFGLIRGTACLRVAINANPFQQGKLLAHFLPNYLDFNTFDQSYAAMHNACIATKRQQPCVEIDCRDVVGVIELPYIAPTNWFDMKSVTNDWGRVSLSVLSPLAVGSAGETTVDVSIYVYFKDVELAAPTVPQMAGGGSKNKFKTKTLKKSDISSEELSNMAQKPISSALRASSQAAGLLGGVPMLSSIMGPAAWALDAAAGVASFLGYSKPLNNIQPTNVSAQYNRYSATSDGSAIGYPLGIRSDNKISITDGLSITNEDEMSFNFLKKVSTCILSQSWSTSNLSGTSLYNQGIHPGMLCETGTKVVAAHTLTWKAGPPAFYLSRSFNLWRGSIQITIKIVKTDFHTGRLQLTWTPGTNTVTAPDNTTSILSLREIIDIRDGGEYTFNLPYMINRHYLPSYVQSGRLDITVLNELRAPETCSSSVDILMYVSGGDDLEFQAPGYNGTSSTIQKVIPFSPQMAEVIMEGVGNEPVKSSITTEFSEASCGEMFCSVKQLLQRTTRTYVKTLPTLNPTGAALQLWPWYQSVGYMDGTGALAGANLGGDALCLLSPMYAYYRGGVSLTILTPSTETVGAGKNSPVVASVVPLSLVATTPIIDNGIYNTSWQAAFDWTSSTVQKGLQGLAVSQSGVGMIAVDVPYYCSMKCSLNLRQTTSNNVPTEQSQCITAVNFSGEQCFAKYAIYRSVRDDFQLSYFIGCPPIYDLLV